MATLNTLQGSAHVKVSGAFGDWSGYILLKPKPANIKYFNLGPTTIGFYEGPILFNGKYYFANGNIRVRHVDVTPNELRVDFVGVWKLNILRPLPVKPDDYLA